MKTSFLQVKKTLRTALLILLLGAVEMMKGYAYDFSAVAPTGQTLYFNKDGYWGPTVIGASPSNGDLVIPEQVFDEDSIAYQVKAIGDSAFYCTSITSVVLPGSIEYIGAYAFAGEPWHGNSLVSVELPKISPCIIGEHAFEYQNLKRINIPNTVNNVGSQAFYHCDMLSSVEFTQSDNDPYLYYKTAIGDYAFSECGICTGLYFGETVSSIGIGAFYQCYSLTSVIIDSYISIENGAFRSSGVTSLTLGENVWYLGNLAFGECYGLASIISYAPYPPMIEYNTFEDVDKSIPVYVQSGQSGIYQMDQYYYWYEFTNYQDCIQFADETVESLCLQNWDINGDGCLSIEEAAAVTDLGEVFRGNMEITSFDELKYFVGLTTIGDYAFSYCSNLVSIELPYSLTSIGQQAFNHCTNIESLIELPSLLTSIGNYAFYCCNKIRLFKIGDSLKTIGDYAFNGCYDLWNGYQSTLSFDGYVLGESVSTIGSHAFYNTAYNGPCIKLVVPNSVISIGDHAFSGSKIDGGSVYLLNLGNPFASLLQTIDGAAFDRCGIGYYDFVIPNSVITIGSSAFRECGTLASVTLGNSLQTIGQHAFQECYFNRVYYTGDIAQWCNISFGSEWRSRYWSNSEHFIDLYINNELVTDLVIPDGVVEIKSYAFGDVSLSSMTLPQSLTTIGRRAFNGCLTSMTVLAETPPSLPLVGYGAFDWVNKSIPVYVPCGSMSTYQNAEGWNEFTNYNEMCDGEVTQTIALSQGWNWFSTNIGITLEDLQVALVEALPGTAITIKSQNNGYTTYNGSLWRGTLSAMDVAQMYRIKVSTDCEITLTDTPINPAEHPVTISYGANWIAFPSNESMTLDDAFAGFAVSGDQIKSQTTTANYNGTIWRPSFSLVPGQGYLYKSNVQGNRTFTFPSNTR